GGKRPGCWSHARRGLVQCARSGDRIAYEGAKLMAPYFSSSGKPRKRGTRLNNAVSVVTPTAKRTSTDFTNGWSIIAARSSLIRRSAKHLAISVVSGRG